MHTKPSIARFDLRRVNFLGLGDRKRYVQDPDVTNPYQATDNTNATGSTLTDSSVNWIPITLLTFAGLILGPIGYFAAAVILETRNVESEPILSYGQQAGLISAPLCAIMCAMIGMSFGLLIGRKAFFGTATLIATGCLGGLAVNSMWSEQIAQHGRDYSEIVLYYPPMSVAIACLLFAVPSGLIAFRQRKQST